MDRTELNHIPDNCKVWIFASPNSISKEISDEILRHTSAFLKQWKAHGKELKSFNEFIDSHFLIIAVDESFEQATGCSIDSMVHFVSEIEKKYNLNLTDRSLVYFRLENKIKSVGFQKIRESINKGIIAEDTLIYNNSIINGSDLKNNWIQKAELSWIKKYFQKFPVK